MVVKQRNKNKKRTSVYEFPITVDGREHNESCRHDARRDRCD